ncbi:GDP-mannose transporter [Fusarium agapanthi]|uniref:GDP-mannose transporter n=1 Tax=Fusarium agapanthi TaxID=1803897 RepID=A0A9P5EDJ1_9HYPO|nr:GDP-mannose transporter [Fusarium agapanthi]
MTDKKNEDYVVQMGNDNYDKNEKPSFQARSPPPAAYGSSPVSGLEQLEKSPPLSILAYCLSSISMTVVNKQGNLHDKALYPFLTLDRFLSVPVYTIFKNLTIIVIAYGEVLWFGGSVTPLALLSFGLMVLSSIVAAWADIQSAINGDFGTADSAAAVSTLNAGYAWMGMNVFCSAAYVLGMRKVIKKMNFKDWDTMYYNNLLTIPVLVVCSLLTEDWSAYNFSRNFPDDTRNKIIIGMIYSGLAAIFISYCSAWCIRITSSTTYSMVGALNKLPIAISGLVFFSAPVTFGSVSAIFLGFISGLVYAWSRVRQSMSSGGSLPTVRPTMSASAKSNRDANS